MKRIAAYEYQVAEGETVTLRLAATGTPILVRATFLGAALTLTPSPAGHDVDGVGPAVETSFPANLSGVPRVLGIGVDFGPGASAAASYVFRIRGAEAVWHEVPEEFNIGRPVTFQITLSL